MEVAVAVDAVLVEDAAVVVTIDVVLAPRTVPESASSANANGISWRMNEVLEESVVESGTGVGVGAGVEVGVEVGTGVGAGAGEDVETSSVVVAPLVSVTSIVSVASSLELAVVMSDVEDVSLSAVVVAVMVDDADDVGASPTCHTSVSPTFVICPDVANVGGKNPPQ